MSRHAKNVCATAAVLLATKSGRVGVYAAEQDHDPNRNLRVRVKTTPGRTTNYEAALKMSKEEGEKAEVLKSSGQAEERDITAQHRDAPVKRRVGSASTSPASEDREDVDEAFLQVEQGAGNKQVEDQPAPAPGGAEGSTASASTTLEVQAAEALLKKKKQQGEAADLRKKARQWPLGPPHNIDDDTDISVVASSLMNLIDEMTATEQYDYYCERQRQSGEDAVTDNNVIACRCRPNLSKASSAIYDFDTEAQECLGKHLRGAYAMMIMSYGQATANQPCVPLVGGASGAPYLISHIPDFLYSKETFLEYAARDLTLDDTKTYLVRGAEEWKTWGDMKKQVCELQPGHGTRDACDARTPNEKGRGTCRPTAQAAKAQEAATAQAAKAQAPTAQAPTAQEALREDRATARKWPSGSGIDDTKSIGDVASSLMNWFGKLTVAEQYQHYCHKYKSDPPCRCEKKAGIYDFDDKAKDCMGKFVRAMFITLIMNQGQADVGSPCVPLVGTGQGLSHLMEHIPNFLNNRDTFLQYSNRRKWTTWGKMRNQVCKPHGGVDTCHDTGHGLECGDTLDK